MSMSLMTRKTRIDAKQGAAIIGSSRTKLLTFSRDYLARAVIYLFRRDVATILSTIIGFLL